MTFLEPRTTITVLQVVLTTSATRHWTGKAEDLGRGDKETSLVQAWAPRHLQHTQWVFLTQRQGRAASEAGGRHGRRKPTDWSPPPRPQHVNWPPTLKLEDYYKNRFPSLCSLGPAAFPGGRVVPSHEQQIRILCCREDQWLFSVSG